MLVLVPGLLKNLPNPTLAAVVIAASLSLADLPGLRALSLSYRCGPADAARLADAMAPEHLELMVRKPRALARRIRNAGAIFMGSTTPEPVGDYVAGPSHVLPTGGSARFFSGLSLSDFYKSSHIISYTKRALDKVREPLEKVAGIERLSKHLDSVKVRFD